MHHENKTFTLRFSLEARFPDDYEGDDDEHAWLRQWERRMKPELIKTVFASLRQAPEWKAYTRNRGLSPDEEIEIVLERDYSTARPASR